MTESLTDCVMWHISHDVWFKLWTQRSENILIVKLQLYRLVFYSEVKRPLPVWVRWIWPRRFLSHNHCDPEFHPWWSLNKKSTASRTGSRRRSLKARPLVKASVRKAAGIYRQKHSSLSFPVSSRRGHVILTPGPFPWRWPQEPKESEAVLGWLVCSSSLWRRFCVSGWSGCLVAGLGQNTGGAAVVSVAWCRRHFVVMLWVQLCYVIRIGFCLTSRMSETHRHNK